MPNIDDLFKIIKVYRNITPFHRYCNKIKDRFGYWGTKIHKLPVYTDNTLINCSLCRVKELGFRKILWSGGIDSTFIICSYIKAHTPFVVYCDKRSINDGTLFFEWMKLNNIPIVLYDDIVEVYRERQLLHGDVADLLFSPDEERRTIINNSLSFYDNMIHIPDRDRLYQQILDYGKLLNKPVETNQDIIRLINFGAMYFHGRDELHYIIFPTHRIESFFDTQEFNNIAYSQFWHRSVKDDKPEMHRFICEVTQDDRMMWAVYRQGTVIPPRLVRVPDNYKCWQD